MTRHGELSTMVLGVRSLSNSHVGFLGEFDFSELLSLGHHVLVLNTHNTTTPGSSEVNVIVETGGEGLLEGIEVLEIFLSDISESDAGGGLHVAELSESCLGLDEAEWNVLLSAESRQEDHDLQWVDVVGHDDKLGLTFLNEGGNMLETELEVDWLWSLSLLLSSLDGSGLGLESLLLLLSGLW